MVLYLNLYNGRGYEYGLQKLTSLDDDVHIYNKNTEPQIYTAIEAEIKSIQRNHKEPKKLHQGIKTRLPKKTSNIKASRTAHHHNRGTIFTNTQLEELASSSASDPELPLDLS